MSRLLWLVVLIAACNTNAAPPSGAPKGERPVSATAAPRDAAVAKPVVDAHPSTLQGGDIYAALCSPCHGKDLLGYAADHAPSLINPTFLESATDDFLKKAIISGRPPSSMAAYARALGGPLDDEAVDRLVAFIRSKGPAAKPSLLSPLATKGDAKRGQPIYDKLCKTCHGDQATRGEAIHLVNASLLSQASDPFYAHAIKLGRPGTKMEAFAKQLTDPQIADVVAYIRSHQTGAPGINALPPPTGKEPLVINPKGKEPTWKMREDRFVAVDDVHKAYKAGAKMIIIDARPPSDWMRAHLKGAVSIPYHDMARLAEIPKDTWVLAYCACPHHLSGLVIDELRKRGHLKSAVLDEGINDWHTKGYPMTTAEGVLPPMKEPPHGAPGHEGHNHPMPGSPVLQ